MMMHDIVRTAAPIAAAAALLASQAAAAGPHGHPTHATGRAVFVQTNDLHGNQIIAFDRAGDGSLTQAGVFDTGGVGARAAGAVSDSLASQGSLVFDAAHSALVAVNAGSDSVTAFAVSGSTLRLLNVVPSGGEFPASIAVSGDLVYVLNAGGSGVVRGYRLDGQGLRPIPHSARSLGLANGNPPNFLTSPGQIGFTPDGSKLIVTTKASGSAIDVFGVGADGTLSASPVVSPSATPVPFAFTFDPSGRLVVGEAGASSVSTYSIEGDGTLSGAKSASDGQTALCWIVPAQGTYFVANTGSNTLSSFRVGADGQPTLLSAVASTTEAGPIDLAATPDQAFLYGETGAAGTLDEYRVSADGSLTGLGVIAVKAGIEGIAAT